MYEKNLTEDLRLRLTERDMNFLRDLSSQRGCSISECIRGIIGEYRRSLESIETLKKALKLVEEKGEKEEGLSYGDTKTDIDNII